MNDLFTIGHSTLEIDPFIAVLKQHGIAAVIDVRSHPFSQYTPQFNRDILENVLQRNDIQYVFLGHELGARREEQECYVGGKAQYNLIANTPGFRDGLDQVQKILMTSRAALMCTEKDPLTCHRMILICRHLRNKPFVIHHILEGGLVESIDEAETRLLEVVGLPAEDLFRDRRALVEEAYDRQGDKIAFTRHPEPQYAEEPTHY